MQISISIKYYIAFKQFALPLPVLFFAYGNKFDYV